MADYGKNGYMDFRRLWELMERKRIGKIDLRSDGVHGNTIQKLKKNENVTTEVLCHLCKVLDCQPGDIMEYKRVGE